MKAKVKTYIVSVMFSSMEVQARNKPEAIRIFRQQMKGLISENDKIIVR